YGIPRSRGHRCRFARHLGPRHHPQRRERTPLPDARQRQGSRERRFCFGGCRAGPAKIRITALVRPGKAPENAEALISEEIAKVTSAPFTEKELERARSSIRRSAVAPRESALSIATSLADTPRSSTTPTASTPSTRSGWPSPPPISKRPRVPICARP